MSAIDLSKSKKVTETGTVKHANELIAEGWVLINTSVGKDEGGFPIVTYVLAWPHEKAPKP